MAIEYVKLNVEGMTCSHCVNAIKTAVGGLDGAGSVDVNLEEKTVSVEFDPNKLTINAIKETIEEEGYEVKNLP